VPSRYLHPLVCTKCGAALPAEQGQQILVCPYCGQSHAFVPPPVPPPLEPGPRQAPWPASSTVTLTYALIGFGVVLVAGIAFTAALAGRNASQSGGAQAGTESATRGPGDPKAAYTKGQAVDIHSGSTWYPGSVIGLDGSKYRAHYDGYSSSWDEWVRADRLRPRTIVDAGADTSAKDAGSDARAYPVPAVDGGDPKATYENGEAVEVLYGSTWWAGSIKQKDGSRYRIGYDGYSDSWDEWVTPKRLRKRGAP
jgi:hypothetical protein